MSLFCPKCRTPYAGGSRFCDRCGNPLPSEARPSWVIGSDRSCDLVLAAQTVSGQHCRLTQDAGGYLVEDLGSTNGVFVDGLRITAPTRVTPGQRVTLGKQLPMPWPQIVPSQPMVAPQSPWTAPPAALPKPGKLTAVGVMTLVSGILNCIWALVLVPYTLGLGMVTCGVGCLLGIFPALALTLGICEIVLGSKLLANPIRCRQPGKAVFILEIISILYGNVPAVVIGILGLTFCNSPEVQEYWASRGAA